MRSSDDLDRQLLAALRSNGREPVANLARLLGVTRATINSRLAKLTASGTIVGFTVRVREDLDPSTVQAVTLIAVDGRSTKDVIRALRGFAEVQSLHTTNGAWDLVAELRTGSLADVDRLLGRIRSIEGVANSETSLFLSSVLS
jgi:DNA-binding Lrp family transcriptional regulator